jgi:hypothetical protein
MMHVIVGLMMIALGVWGVMDEWYYALDSLKAIGALGLTIGGFLALLGGVFGQPRPAGAADPDPARPTDEGADDDIAAATAAVSNERLMS